MPGFFSGGGLIGRLTRDRPPPPPPPPQEESFSAQEALRGGGSVQLAGVTPAKIIFGRRRISVSPSFYEESERILRLGYALSLGEIEGIRGVYSRQHDEWVPLGRGRLVPQTWYGGAERTPKAPLGSVPLVAWKSTAIFDDGGYVAQSGASEDDAGVDRGDIETSQSDEDDFGGGADRVLVVNGRDRNFGDYSEGDGRIGYTASAGTAAGNADRAFSQGAIEGTTRSPAWSAIIGGALGLVLGGFTGAILGARYGYQRAEERNEAVEEAERNSQREQIDELTRQVEALQEESIGFESGDWGLAGLGSDALGLDYGGRRTGEYESERAPTNLFSGLVPGAIGIAPGAENAPAVSTGSQDLDRTAISQSTAPAPIGDVDAGRGFAGIQGVVSSTGGAVLANEAESSRDGTINRPEITGPEVGLGPGGRGGMSETSGRTVTGTRTVPEAPQQAPEENIVDNVIDTAIGFAQDAYDELTNDDLNRTDAAIALAAVAAAGAAATLAAPAATLAVAAPIATTIGVSVAAVSQAIVASYGAVIGFSLAESYNLLNSGGSDASDVSAAAANAYAASGTQISIDALAQIGQDYGQSRRDDDDRDRDRDSGGASGPDDGDPSNAPGEGNNPGVGIDF